MAEAPTIDATGSEDKRLNLLRRLSNPLQLLWSFAERTLPRLASAVLLLGLAYFVNPHVVGLYSWAVLGVTVFQSVSDVAVRQVAIPALRSAKGVIFLRRYPPVAAVSGSLFVASVITIIWIASGGRIEALLLYPLALTPIVTNSGIVAVAKLQVAHKWRFLAAGQLVAALLSLSATLPILIFSQSVLACALQIVLTETVFSIWCNIAARKLPRRTEALTDVAVMKDFFGMSIYGLLGWGQGQTDRLLIGSFAGTATLGYYATASSIARSLGDSMAAATANVLRARLPQGSGVTSKEVRLVVAKVLRVAGGLGMMSVVGVWAIAHFALEPLLGVVWLPALRAVPIVALSAVLSIISWSATTLMVAQGRSARGLPVQILGIAMAIPIAIAATSSLELAAWFVVARDLSLMLLISALAGRLIPWRVVLVLTAGTGLLALGIHVLM